jgi:hypothetical protein
MTAKLMTIHLMGGRKSSPKEGKSRGACTWQSKQILEGQTQQDSEGVDSAIQQYRRLKPGRTGNEGAISRESFHLPPMNKSVDEVIQRRILKRRTVVGGTQKEEVSHRRTQKLRLHESHLIITTDYHSVAKER